MEKENNKTSRANQTRSKSERPKVWVPPGSASSSRWQKGIHRGEDNA